MKQDLYIFSDTQLKRKDSTLLCETIARNGDLVDEETCSKDEFFLGENIIIPTGDKKYIPIESINSIFSFGTLHFNSRFLYFLSRFHIPLHVFNINGNYSGSFMPLRDSSSGHVLLSQIETYHDLEKRLKLAKVFASGAAFNMLSNLKYYNNRKADLSSTIDTIEKFGEKLKSASSINQLLGYEGNIRSVYFSAWQKIISIPIEFYRRTTRPPMDMINSLISYGNVIVYSVCLNEIYKTYLYPEIGFLHQPSENKFPLSYDIAEIFKPLLTDRIIFKLFNKFILSENDFSYRNDFCYIKKKAKQTFIKEFDDKLNTIIKDRNDERNKTYKTIILNECNKIVKHLNGEQEYIPYKAY
ncbi:MAG: type I-B CRISPR-associated endonuclease Cas1b [Bacteroidetes bacterium]|nr:type I-B CRISPR-associated endonuclease Cas1b [Bacteroidota bacterium]MBU2584300.1 type I-B CRISPR-associated endonuclease Cas1b [Bacteroidota bacterium]